MPSRKTLAHAGQPGSPSSGEPVYLAVGIFRRPHGVQGDLLLEIYTDFPERIRPGTQLYVGDEKQTLKITRRRPHANGLLLGLAGVTDLEQAGRYRNQVAYVPADDRPSLPEGEYYHHQILGLQVLDESGHELGTVREILQTGANDVYVVAGPDGREILLPALKQVLLGVDLEQKILHVHLLPGLIDEGER